MNAPSRWPANSGSRYSEDQMMAITDEAERQAAFLRGDGGLGSDR